ncbi:MAG TPA: hypothetical protein VGJ73_02400 [Verrucomicrobiae bacterium]
MSAITSLSARQLRRAAELKEKIQLLESELNRLPDSPDGGGIHVVPRRHGRLRFAIKAGLSAVAESRWTRAGARSVVVPAQRLKRQLSSAARARIATAARSRLERIRNIDIT